MSQPRVTVVIPTYNRSDYLKQAIESVLAQTYSHFNLLVSDNASTDNTREMVESFDDERIFYHSHPENLGMLNNYRFALTYPQTEFVAYLSDDDLYTSQLLETAIALLDQHPEAAYFACSAKFFGDETEGELRPHAITDRETPFLYMPPASAVSFLGLDNPGPMTVCRRRVLHNEIQWPKSDYVPGDLFILTQLMVQGGFVFSNLPLYRFRIHGQNASYTPSQKRTMLKVNLMVWYGVRWLTRYLLEKRICTLEDIERHGMEAVSQQHVVPFVLGLSSFGSSTPLRSIAERVFHKRKDMDRFSSRFRLARKLGFWILPMSEKISQWRTGWIP